MKTIEELIKFVGDKMRTFTIDHIKLVAAALDYPYQPNEYGRILLKLEQAGIVTGTKEYEKPRFAGTQSRNIPRQLWRAVK